MGSSQPQGDRKSDINIKWIKAEYIFDITIKMLISIVFLAMDIVIIFSYSFGFEGPVMVRNIFELIAIASFFFGITVLILYWSVWPKISEYNEFIKMRSKIPMVSQTTHFESIKKSTETRLLTQEELVLLHNKKNMSYMFGAIIASMGICIGIFMFFFAAPIGLAFLFVFVFPGISFCALFIYDGRKSYKDEKNGIAEVIRGKLTDKYHSGRGGTNVLVINDKIIPIEYAFWNSVNIGDSIYVDLGPYSNEIFNIKKI